jgi:hypothetical protein
LSQQQGKKRKSFLSSNLLLHKTAILYTFFWCEKGGDLIKNSRGEKPRTKGSVLRKAVFEEKFFLSSFFSL